jgi:hypothetical protein
MACGFFACTNDYTADATELSPQPEGELMDATAFANFTAALEDFGLFAEGEQLFEGEYGSEDFRIYIDKDEDEECPTVDFLTNSDDLDDERTLKETRALRPARNWSTSITLHHQPEDAQRFQNWLTDNFSGSTHVDLRLSFDGSGEMVISGLKPTQADLEQFPDQPLFNFN